MARTRQTARRSTGGRAPRRQLATQAARRSYSCNDNLSTGNENMKHQMNLYKESGGDQRTIIVEGQSELLEPPNLVYLSFKTTSADNDTLQCAIRNCMAKMSSIRSIAADYGVSHENVTSDSIGSKSKRIEYGKYVKKPDDDESTEWKVFKTKVKYQAESVVRIMLEADDDDDIGSKISALYSKVCYSIMIHDDNIVMQEAPRYELSDITRLRNDARRSACENAKEKATFIIDALDDDSVKLGNPVCFTDIHCDLKDDAEESFCGSLTELSSWDVSKVVIEDDSQENDEEKEEVHVEGQERRSLKRQRLEEDSKELGDDEISRVFAVPPIRVAACIKAVFEINTNCANVKK